ncbi:hypothetical protein ACFE04_023753 [Oxalis oulophora]
MGSVCSCCCEEKPKPSSESTNAITNNNVNKPKKEEEQKIPNSSGHEDHSPKKTANVVMDEPTTNVESGDNSALGVNGLHDDEDEQNHSLKTTNVVMGESTDSALESGVNVNGPQVDQAIAPIPKISGVNGNNKEARKRALLCGVSYTKGERLDGTLNDVILFKDLLITTFGFGDQNICVLTEEELDQPGKEVEAKDRIPTRENIMNSLKWLVEDCKSGDSLVFYFAGHGRQVPDTDMDEKDGYDEAICPCDFEEEGSGGYILDDEINSTIVAPLINGVTLHAIVDACHSGTILDLQCIYNRTK